MSISACKEQCNAATDCIGISVTSPSWVQNHPGDTRCLLCKNVKGYLHGHQSGNWHAYWKVAPAPTAASFTWDLIAKQDTSRMLFDSASKTSFKMNEQNPDSDAFMNIGAEDHGLQINGKYRLKLMYDSSTVVEWEQSSWLTSGTILGFQCISPADCGPSAKGAGIRFQGLGKSSSYQSVLDGDGDSTNSWSGRGGPLPADIVRHRAFFGLP